MDENDIVNVAIGDSATIEVDALPDKIFKGTVTEIASSAKISGQGSADQKTDFEVKIQVLDAGDLLRPGMTASSDIITDIRDSALAVPIQCVAVGTPDQLKPLKNATKPNEAMADDSSFQNYVPGKDGFVEVVFVVKDKMVDARQVKTGIQSDTHIEIIEGLNLDDEIVIGNYRAISQDLRHGSMVTYAQN